MINEVTREITQIPQAIYLKENFLQWQRKNLDFWRLLEVTQTNDEILQTNDETMIR